MRYPVLEQTLRVIKTIAPESCKTVIDIGVQRKTEFLMEELPNSFHHLFEPSAIYYDELITNYNNKGINYKLHKVALSNSNGILYLHNTSVDGSGNITHAQILDEPNNELNFLVNIQEIPTLTLDTAMSKEDKLEPYSYITKLDVDGVEEKIISCGKNTLENSSFIIIEASVGRRDLFSRSALIENLGFRLFDICDNAYYFGQLALVDLVFINENVRMKEIKFRPWEYSEGKVIWKKWQHGFNNLKAEKVEDPYK